MYYTYILFSEVLDCFYVGHTNDLKQRVLRHNAKKEKYTSSGVPWILIWSTAKNSRSESMILEKKLKNLARKRKISFMLKYHEGIAGPDEMLLLKHLSGC
jgi:putative endonuclease